MNGFDCEARDISGGRVLAVRGDVDLASAGRLEAEAGGLLKTGSLLVLDCSEVTFMDSMGLRALMDLNRQAGDHGAGFVLAAPSYSVRRLLELAGVDGVLTVRERVPGEEPVG